MNSVMPVGIVPQQKLYADAVADGSMDLGHQSVRLLTDLHLLSASDEKDPVEDIATNLVNAKPFKLTVWTAWLTGGGGAAALTGLGAWFLNSGQQPLKMMALVAFTVMFASLVFALAWIVTTDVQVRGSAQEGKFRARTEVFHDYAQMVTAADVPKRVTYSFKPE